MEKKKKPVASRSKRHKGKTEMVTPDGILIWVPDKKVKIKKVWGWKTVSEMNK
ncbi:MAG: hypothetical protein H8E14_02725 [Candidatus Marinimicrobia bacterium]|nr:hypothetical protein [Candidatus Neomarinimicrobiota bacterium]